MLQLVKPFLPLLPEVPAPEGRKVPFKDKAIYTLVVLGIFLVCSQLPLYGIRASEGSDPFYWARVIMASNRGTVMELGISPIVTSGLVMQLLVGSKIININPNVKADRQLQKGAEKLVGILITLGEAIAYVFSGMYGDIREIGYFKAFLIVAQLFAAGLLVLCLDEMLSNGYGLASGISLFIATNICETIVWKAFSPYTIAMYGRMPQFEGAVINAFHLFFTRSDKIRALKEAFYRPGLPNITNILATAAIFLLVIYLQGWKVTVMLQTPKRRATDTSNYYPYQIKLFYTSNMPIILHSALVSNFYFISQLLWKKFSGALIVRLLGSWREVDGSGQLAPSGGLVYYITAPPTLSAAIANPLHTAFYITFVLTACALFSKTWIEVSGSSSRDVAKQLTEQGLAKKGHKLDEKTLKKELDRYIPTAAAFGGMCIGALTVTTDFIGALEKGTSILLATNMIYGLFESYEREAKQAQFGL